ncbi:hypothetical protein ACH5A2_22785 [Streptomyces collinus]|uniref:hypothetical protein n=1 Tax=Streptomyces collinus TaxID=42684 RepID=UPI00378E12D2
MGFFDVSGKLGQTLKLHDYWVCLEKVSILDVHPHPKYCFVVFHLWAEERTSPVTRQLETNERQVLLEGYEGHYFDFDAIFNRHSDREEGDIISEYFKTFKRASFQLTEYERGWGDAGPRTATWKYDFGGRPAVQVGSRGTSWPSH